MKGVRAGWRAAVFAAAALAVSCSGADETRRRAPGEAALRMWMPNVVWWEAGRPRHVDFAIENSTSRTVALAAPDPANARVEIYGPESLPLCGVAPGGRPAPGPRIALAPGDSVTVHVDLETACASVPPGEYRFEVGYRAGDASGPVAPGDASAFIGTLPPQYGHVVVSRPAEAVCDPPSEPPERGRQGRSAPPGAGRGRARRAPVAAPTAGNGR